MTEESTQHPESIVIAGVEDRHRRIIERNAKQERRGRIFRRVLRVSFLLCVATGSLGMSYSSRYPWLMWPAGISILLLIPLLPIVIFTGAFIPGQYYKYMNKRDKSVAND